MKRIRIAEGIYLNILRQDKFKTDYYDCNLILPLAEETASMAALLPSVLRRGCESYPTMALLNRRLDYLYASSAASRVMRRGENQIIGFTGDFLRESLVPAGTDLLHEVFSLLRELLFAPCLENGAFREDYVTSEKKNQIDAINALINNKNAYALRRCHEIMCEGEAFAVSESGTVEGVEAITPASLYAFYKELIKKARVEFFYTGACDDEKVITEVTSLFAGIERGDVYRLGTKKFVRRDENLREVTEEMPVAQGKLMIGMRSGHALADDRNFTIFSLFNELYGGSPSSKLFCNVREKLSLCYYCRSMPEAHKGLLTVMSGIENENRDKAVSEILRQLDDMKAGVFTDEELDDARRSLINSYKELDDDGTSLPLWYLSRLIVDDFTTVEQVIGQAEKVTRDEIIAYANDVVPDTVYFLKGTLKNEGGDEE